MSVRPVAFLIVCAALSGCVVGYGPCLFLSPMPVSLTGTMHFRTYKVGDAIERVAVLTSDRSEYIYAPAQSHQCLMAGDFQLAGWDEYPGDLVDGTRIAVRGALIESASPHQHTRFLLRIRNLERLPHQSAAAGAPPKRK